MISRGIILRSVQVNSSAILIQTRVVDNNFCKSYECHCESFIVRIIFSYLFFASAGKKIALNLILSQKTLEKYRKDAAKSRKGYLLMKGMLIESKKKLLRWL